MLDSYDASYGIAKLDHAIDWGWFRWFEKPIFYLLDWLFHAGRQFRRGDHPADADRARRDVPDRAAPVPLGMAQMKAVQPKMKALQERTRTTRQRSSRRS